VQIKEKETLTSKLKTIYLFLIYLKMINLLKTSLHSTTILKLKITIPIPCNNLNNITLTIKNAAIKPSFKNKF